MEQIRREPELKEAIAEFRAMLDETKSSQPQSIAIRGSSTTTTTPATSLLAPSSSSSSTTIATAATSVPAPSISSSGGGGTVITMDSFHVSPRHSGDAMSFYDSPGSSIDSEPDDSMVPSQVDCSSFGAAQAVAASVSASASSRRYRGHSRSASASASASTSASASATGSPFHAEPGSHTMVTIENLPTLLAESLQPLADPTELSSSSSPPSSPMRNDLTDSGGKSATVVIQQPPPQQQQQQPLQQPLNAATAAVSLVSYHGSLAKRSKQRRKRTGSLQLMAHQQVNALGLTSTSPTSEGSAFAANMFPAGGHSSLGTAGGAAAIAAIAAAGGALLPNMHSASYPSMLPPEYLHAASASIAIQQQLSGGGSGTSPPSATAGLSSSPSTGSEEKGTNYYNQQLLNRGVDRGGLQPTRESLSSSTFASKLLKAASTKRSEGRLSEHGFDGAIKDQGLVVQWLWRAPSSWQAYSTFDHDRLEEAYQNDRNRQQNIVVDQGRAFVSVTERVHVSLSNGMSRSCESSRRRRLSLSRSSLLVVSFVL